MSFRVHKVDQDELKGDPTTVDGHVLPVNGIQGDGVHVGGEESSTLAKDLLDTDTTAADSVREKLDKVSCRGCVNRLFPHIIQLSNLLYVRALFPRL